MTSIPNYSFKPPVAFGAKQSMDEYATERAGRDLEALHALPGVLKNADGYDVVLDPSVQVADSRLISKVHSALAKLRMNLVLMGILPTDPNVKISGTVNVTKGADGGITVTSPWDEQLASVDITA
jgi:hypothetical protein